MPWSGGHAYYGLVGAERVYYLVHGWLCWIDMHGLLPMSSWGLREGMEFTREGADEMLRELVVHLASRASRSTWTWEMVYQEEYNSNRHDIRKVVSVAGGCAWYYGGIRDYTDDNDGFDALRRLIAVKVCFAQDPIQASVCFMTCCETLQGFYYLSYFKWVARFSTVEEGVALFDAMADNLDLIIAAADRDAMEVSFAALDRLGAGHTMV